MQKTLQWLYRVLAFILIFLLSFTIVYTIHLFTPGIEGGGIAQNCPSPISNPKPVVTDQYLRDSIYINKQYEIQDQAANIEALRKTKDPVAHSLLLTTTLHDLIEVDVKRAEDPVVMRFNKNTNAILCASDRMDRDEKFSAIMYGNPDDRNIYFQFLTIQTVIVLWIAVFLMGAPAFFIRKKIGKHKHVNKVFRIIASGFFVVLFAYVAIAPVVDISNNIGPREKACTISDALDSPRPVGGLDEVGIVGMSSAERVLTKTDAELIAKVESTEEIKLTAEQKVQLSEGYKSIRQDSIEMFERYNNLETIKNLKANEKLADSDCIQTARLNLSASLFGTLNLIFFALFMKGLKNTNAGDEPIGEDDDKAITNAEDDVSSP